MMKLTKFYLFLILFTARIYSVCLISVYIETARQVNAGNININIAATPTGQIRTWKVSNIDPVNYNLSTLVIRTQI